MSFQGRTIAFGTKHGKGSLLKELFLTYGLFLEEIPIDTDCFGTFSGERERPGTVRETLLLKADLTHKVSGHALVLASEGSFAPHPFISGLSLNLETMLFKDFDSGLTIEANHVSEHTNHAEELAKSEQEVHLFLKKIGFPEAGVILKAGSEIIKDLKIENEILTHAKRLISGMGEVTLLSDMRADRNPLRRDSLIQTADKLLLLLNTPCPICKKVGFGYSVSERGLPCEACGSPTSRIAHEVHECPHCFHAQRLPRADGLRSAPADECPSCNP